jgi:hypothetical protein
MDGGHNFPAILGNTSMITLDLRAAISLWARPHRRRKANR